MLQKTNLFHALPVIIIASLLVVAIIYAWTEPSVAPPGGNVAAPINISVFPQIKSGALQVNGFRNIGTTILDGNVGIGTAAAPSQKLDVAGYVKGTGLCIGSDCRTSLWSGWSGTFTTGCRTDYFGSVTVSVSNGLITSVASNCTWAGI